MNVNVNEFNFQIHPFAIQTNSMSLSTWFRRSFKRAIDLFDREKTHYNFDTSKLILQFNETVIDIFESFILWKQPPVITKKKKLKQTKNKQIKANKEQTN